MSAVGGRATVRRRRDPQATQRAILDAAESIFVDRGFAATSVSEIADRATVTKSLIHHHFGSKEALWQEVKARRLAAFSVVQKKAMMTGEADSADFEQAIRAFFGFLSDNPKYVRLTAWMYLDDPELSAPADPELLEIALQRIELGQRSGQFRSDIESRHILASFISLSSHWFLARDGFGQMGDPQPADEADAAYLEDMLQIFLRGIEPG